MLTTSVVRNQNVIQLDPAHAVTSSPTVHLTETTLVTSHTPVGPRTTVLSSADSVETPHPVNIYTDFCLFIFASETRACYNWREKNIHDLISEFFLRLQGFF